MESDEQYWIDPDEWLGLVRREYLDDFVRQGGATVKVVVPREERDREGLLAGLQAAAEERGFTFATVDAATTKIHLVDKLFHRLAGQVAWEGLAHSFVRDLLHREGYVLPEKGAALDLDTLAELTGGRDRAFLSQDLRRVIEQSLTRDYGMCQEFRAAMVELCRETLGQGSVPEGVVGEWLRGELRLISMMKPCLVFQKVARHNARHMLLSLVHWLRVAGGSGLVLVLDISRYTVEKRPTEPDGTLYYSRSALLDAYEVIRQFIDGSDDAQGCFLVVLASPEALSHETRSLRAYNALWFRVQDEVRDRHRPNPLSTLVRISRAVASAAPSTGGGAP